jgi:hypothetical protein
VVKIEFDVLENRESHRDSGRDPAGDPIRVEKSPYFDILNLILGISQVRTLADGLCLSLIEEWKQNPAQKPSKQEIIKLITDFDHSLGIPLTRQDLYISMVQDLKQMVHRTIETTKHDLKTRLASSLPLKSQNSTEDHQKDFLCLSLMSENYSQHFREKNEHFKAFLKKMMPYLKQPTNPFRETFTAPLLFWEEQNIKNLILEILHHYESYLIVMSRFSKEGFEDTFCKLSNIKQCVIDLKIHEIYDNFIEIMKENDF